MPEDFWPVRKDRPASCLVLKLSSATSVSSERSVNTKPPAKVVLKALRPCSTRTENSLCSGTTKYDGLLSLPNLRAISVSTRPQDPRVSERQTQTAGVEANHPLRCGRSQGEASRNLGESHGTEGCEVFCQRCRTIVFGIGRQQTGATLSERRCSIQTLRRNT